MGRLKVTDHDRDSAGLTYVYPVVSRRAGGVSVGVNLNPNNACNWRCVYCQVPGLVRGKAPELDLDRLEGELAGLLHDIVEGDFMQARVPEGSRRLNDVALSGNGEPTTSKQFAAVIARIRGVLERFDLLGRIAVVLITNGSMSDQPHVQEGLRAMAGMGGQVWFKLDRATEAGLAATNSVRMTPDDHRARLVAVSGLCPTWVQTCMFQVDGAPPEAAEIEAYLGTLRAALDAGAPLQGVLLYGLARDSHQPEAARLSPVPAAWLEALGERIRGLGLTVKVTP